MVLGIGNKNDQRYFKFDNILLEQNFFKQKRSRLEKIIGNGAEGRTRTDTRLLPPDFESSVSTNSTTSAYHKVGIIPTYSLKKLNGALGETRTRTRLLPPPPQDGVSTNSTTSAKNSK